MTFAPSPDGTSVTLVHRGWDTLGDRAEAVRGDYETGWDIAFVARFGGAAQAAGDQ